VRMVADADVSSVAELLKSERDGGAAGPTDRSTEALRAERRRVVVCLIVRLLHKKVCFGFIRAHKNKDNRYTQRNSRK
jgi:hypothetical protein